MRQPVRQMNGLNLAFMRSVCWAAVLLIVSCASPIRSPKTLEARGICYVGTAEYVQRIAKLRLTPGQAEAKLAEYLRERTAGHNVVPKFRGTGRHLLLIDGAYHFFMPRKSGGIPLTGYYVDGLTGRVEFRTVEGSVSYPR